MPSAGLKQKVMPPAKPAAPPQKSSKVGLYVAIGVAVVGIGGFLALRGGGKGTGGETNQQQQTTTTPTPPSTGTQTATVESTKTPPPVAQRNPPATQQTTTRNTRPTRQTRQNPPPVVQQPPAASEAQGFFTIDADPAGEVYIDGVDAGPTPVVKYGVKPGTHRIRIESAGYQNKNDQLPVEAGNTVRKKYTLVPS
jgi:cytoskeletal protein RodZ